MKGPETRLRKAQRTAINAFLIFHVFSIACWGLPMSNPLANVYRSWVRPYFLWAGLFQSWDMFSPSPKTINSYVDAIVLYEGGVTRNWSFPRMEQLSLSDRYFRERYRKFVENLKEDKNSALWPDAARFIARLNDAGTGAVTRVYLVHHWSEIIPNSSGPYHPQPWQTYMFYRYVVEPDDLK
jgi:hypothetical protein